MNALGSSPAFSYFDILNLWRQNGCPICQLSTRSVKHFLNDLFSKSARDPDIIFRLLKSRGLCLEHSKFLLEEMTPDGLGTSIVYEHIIKSIRRGFSAAGPSLTRASTAGNSRLRPRAVTKLKKTFMSEGRCPACEQRDAAVNRLLDELGKHLSNERIQVALQKSDGICLPHLVSLLERVQSFEDTEFLLTLTQQKLETVQFDMQNLITKLDRPSQVEEPSREEARAWRKALSMISGASVSPTGEKHET